MPAQKPVLAVLEDLFFTVKINDAAKRAGLTPRFLKSEVDVLQQAKDGAALIVVDLTFKGVDPIALVQKLKADEATRNIDVIGYLPHVDGEGKQAAQEAGYDMVLAKSAFSTNLPQLMKRHA